MFTIRKDNILLFSYVVSYFVFLRLSMWGGGFSGLSSVDLIGFVKVLIRLATFFVAVIFLMKYTKKFNYNTKKPFNSICLFFILALLSIVYSSDRFYSAFRLAEHAGYLMFSYAIVICSFDRYNSFEKTIHIGVNAVLIPCGILVLIVWTFAFLAPQYAYRHIVGDISGFGGDILQVHTLANISVAVFSILFHRMLSEARSFNIFRLAFMLLLLATVYLTRSRSGMLILVAVVFVVGAYHVKLKYSLILYPILILSLGAAVIGNLDYLTQYILRGQDWRDLISLTERVNFWVRISEDTLSESPIVGYGYQMLSYEGLHKSFNDKVYVVSNAHNTFIQTLAGLGVLGLVVLLYHLAQVMRVMRFLYVRSTDNERHKLFEVVILLAVCVLGSLTQYGIVGMTTPIVPIYMMIVALCSYLHSFARRKYI